MLSDIGVCAPEPLLISCVTVTTGRSELIKGAVNSFLRQTYPNRELIILSQGSVEDNDKIRKLVEPHENIYFVEATPRLTLGEMRNLSVELTHGDVICQWDDDDFYHPNRLSAQFKSLRSNAVASLYTAHMKYFADTKQLFLIDYLRGTDDYLRVAESDQFKWFLCGSVMFKKWCYHFTGNRLYPERGEQSDREEDLNVLQKLMWMGPVAPVHTPYHYCYVYHGTNVYERRHHEMLFHKKHIFDMDELFENLTGIDETLRAAGVQNPVEICTSPILDFDDPATRIDGDAILSYNPKYEPATL